MRTSVLARGAEMALLAKDLRRASRSHDETVRRNAQIHVASRMGRLRGLPQKFGQILSMSDDDGKAESFAPLTDSAEALSLEEVVPLLEAAWNRPLDSIVERIERDAHAASLGQVHEAVLCDGRRVAIKIQYPGIRQAVMNDLKMLGWLSTPVGDLRRGFDLSGYRSAIRADLEQELDYRIEADHQRRMRREMEAHCEWIIPAVVDELSTETVLVTEWVDGEKIDALEAWTQADRNAVATVLVQGFMRMVFGSGFFHADPHAGNYRFVRTATGPRVVLYDFGSVAVIDERRQAALLKLIEVSAQRHGDPFKPLVALGFDERLLSPMRGKLPPMCAVLFEPFTCPGKFPIARWNRKERVSDILGEDRWNFRFAGPADLIFLMRAFHGLIHHLEHLNAEAAWSIALRPYVSLHAARVAEIDAAPDGAAAAGFGAMAEKLSIRVEENGRTKVRLTFPVMSVDDLPHLMDDELRTRIATAGHNLAEIARRARATAYVPQTLFQLNEGSRRITVELV